MALGLSLPPIYTEDNFLVTDSNREARRWIDHWPNWPGGILLLHGPKGSGKTHLAHLWAARARAAALTPQEGAAAALQERAPSLLAEDIEQWPPNALLHLFNAAREASVPLLLTASTPAARLPFTLPDLTS